MKHLLDADAIIDYLTGQPGARQQFPALQQDGVAVSVITMIELYEGVERGREPERAHQQLQDFLKPVHVVPVSDEIARQTAHLRAELRARRRPIQHRAYDLIIAATALTHNLTLVTSNTRDYSDIPRLALLNVREQR